MTVLIAGGGIGGLTCALALHHAGLSVEIYERARGFTPLGVGINLLPHAVKALTGLGLRSALERVAVATQELIYSTRRGQVVWREPRGLAAGYDTPQLSIHRGALHAALVDAVLERIGAAHMHTGCAVVAFSDEHERVTAHVERYGGRERIPVYGDVLVGCDGIHSVVRQQLYPRERLPIWNGHMLWRGTTDGIFGGGRAMLIAGGNDAKFVAYPIVDPRPPHGRLLNWGILARMAPAGAIPPRRDDWSRPGLRDEVHPFVRDRFHLGSDLDPAAIVDATPLFYEYPNCDREPLPAWSFGRVTLLGDAAHPMHPVGSNGASQAILDACALARQLSHGGTVASRLLAYDAERRPPTNAIVVSNRRGGPERVIDLVENRAPEGFADLDAIASYSEREAIVRGYASLAGYAREQVNDR